jgi:DNA-binding CsgD family transcriptional regulator
MGDWFGNDSFETQSSVRDVLRANNGTFSWSASGTTSGINFSYNTSTFSTNDSQLSNVVSASRTQTTVPITVGTNPAGRSYVFNGTTYSSQQTFNLTPGSTFTLSTNATLPLGPWQLRIPAGPTERVTQFCQALREHMVLAWQRLQPCNGGIPIEKLSKRQKEVLPLLLRGESNAEIAYQLGISVRTVEKHVGSLLHVSNCPSRSQLNVKLTSANA